MDSCTLTWIISIKKPTARNWSVRLPATTTDARINTRHMRKSQIAYRAGVLDTNLGG